VDTAFHFLIQGMPSLTLFLISNLNVSIYKRTRIPQMGDLQKSNTYIFCKLLRHRVRKMTKHKLI
jgi:hypothetical protein